MALRGPGVALDVISRLLPPREGRRVQEPEIALRGTVSYQHASHIGRERNGCAGCLGTALPQTVCARTNATTFACALSLIFYASLYACAPTVHPCVHRGWQALTTKATKHKGPISLGARHRKPHVRSG